MIIPIEINDMEYSLWCHGNAGEAHWDISKGHIKRIENANYKKKDLPFSREKYEN